MNFTMSRRTNNTVMRTSKHFRILFTSLLLSVCTAVYADSEDPNTVNPDPKYSPTDVVSIQMNALKNNDLPYEDAGIEITFRFASPSNKSNTGPIDRFKTLFDSSDYSPMLNHDSLEIGPVTYSQSSANVPIFILTGTGQKIPYIFRLDKVDQSPYENCWMTSAVVRIPTDSFDLEDKPI